MSSTPDLTAPVAGLLLTASRIDNLLADGAEFRRLNIESAQRLDVDLERSVTIVSEIRAELLKHRGAAT